MADDMQVQVYGVVIGGMELFQIVEDGRDEPEWDKLPGFVCIMGSDAFPLAKYLFMTPDARDKCWTRMKEDGFHPIKTKPELIPMRILEGKLKYDAGLMDEAETE